MGTIANAKVTHYYNCYNGDFIGCLLLIKQKLKRVLLFGGVLFFWKKLLIKSCKFRKENVPLHRF